MIDCQGLKKKSLRWPISHRAQFFSLSGFHPTVCHTVFKSMYHLATPFYISILYLCAFLPLFLSHDYFLNVKSRAVIVIVFRPYIDTLSLLKRKKKTKHRINQIRKYILHFQPKRSFAIWNIYLFKLDLI